MLGKNSSSSTVTLSAGGMAVWLAVTAAITMAAMNLILVAMVIDHSRKIDDLNHYLTSIYMMAPQLKPPEQAK